MIKKDEMDRLVRYLSGESSLEERQEVELWIEQNNSNKMLFKKLCDIWSVNVHNMHWETEGEWKEFLNRIADVPELTEQAAVFIADRHTSRRIVFNSLFNILTKKNIIRFAIALIFVLSGYSLINYLGFFPGPNNNKIIWNEKITSFGQKANIVLGDNSKVSLNSGSRLRYPLRFTDSQRDVYLEGEAYFEVSHESDRKFVVHTGTISTVVLGTKFDISAFPDEKNITVSLLEGKVKIQNLSPDQKLKSESVFLNPRQQWTYNTDTKSGSISEINMQNAIGWKDNILVFENTPLEKVLSKLKRTYGISFECETRLKGKYFITTKFENQSLWLVAEVIKKTTGLNYKTIKEDDITKKIIFF